MKASPTVLRLFTWEKRNKPKLTLFLLILTIYVKFAWFNIIWINYANNATLEYIQNRLTNKTGSVPHPDITFRYGANATWYANATFWVSSDRFIARNETSGQEVSWELNGFDYVARHFVNGSYEEEYTDGFPVLAQDVGMVYLHLQYSETYGLLAAFCTGVRQIVLTNSTGQIISVLISNLGPMIS